MADAAPGSIEQILAAAAERGAERAFAAAEDRIVARVLAEMARRWPLADGWSTRRELAEQLDVAVDTIDRRIARRDPEIEVRKVGRAVRLRLRRPVSEAEIDAMASEARR